MAGTKANGSGGNNNASSSPKNENKNNSPSASGSIPADPQSVRELLTSVNQPQSLEANLRNLQSSTIGGITGLTSLLGTDPDGGIDPSTIEDRRSAFGCNYLPSAPRKSFWQLFVDTFDDATVQILMAAAAVSLVVGLYDDPATGYVEGLAILAAVLLVAVVTAVNDYEKEKQFESLSEANDDVDVLVVRGGVAHQVSIRDLVIGDVVCVEAGDQIPCDGVLLTCDGLELDESALTGEPIDIDKDLTHDPFVLSGCTANAGSGNFVAIAVGRHSQWGVIKSHLEKEQDQTPLQEKLDDMAALIGYVGMAAAAATFVAMMAIKLFVRPTYLDDVSVFSYALDAFIIGVTIVVVAVPEGLPLAVTISLAYSTKKMLADQNLIRHLAACETMGNATNICSDKTGTLTENRMTVVRGTFANVAHDDTAGPNATANISPQALDVILQGIATCSTARVVPPEIAHADDDPDALVHDLRPALIGNKTEAALLLLAQGPFGKYDDTDARRVRARFGKPDGSRLFPFSSVRKRMSVIVNETATAAAAADANDADTTNGGGSGSGGGRVTRSKAKGGGTNTALAASPSNSGRWTLYHKGAAETVLDNCTSYLEQDGTVHPLTPPIRNKFRDLIHSYATDALRCVALCHRSGVDSKCDPSKVNVGECADLLENEMCLDALVGIADPLRGDVVDSVATCQRAGIFVRMVTGDNLDTARAIAREAGILTDDGISMIGEDFRKLTPAQLDDVLPRLQVLARSSPEDKHMLVQRLNGGLMPTTEEQWLEVHPGKDYMTQRDKLLPGHMEEWAESRGGVGEVVGVTGDGTNDGPALKAADVGLSMGISGTDVAKNASDIIIMDDKFSSIVKAVLWGRSVFDNIRKFLQFQLTVNVVALTITFLSAVCGYKPPLNAVMMLWVNLIMDTMGALALGTEPPAKELLDRRPYKRDASLINRPMWRNILVQAAYQLGLLIFLLKQGPALFGCVDGSRHHFTILFNAFVFCQVFNEFNAREIGDVFDPFKRLDQSPMFLVVVVFTVIAQWIIVEFGGDFTQTYPLTVEEWKITFLLGAMSIPVGYIMRLIPIDEDPESFAGIGDNLPQKKHTSAFGMVSLLLPVLAAGAYQYYKTQEGL